MWVFEQESPLDGIHGDENTHECFNINKNIGLHQHIYLISNKLQKKVT